MKLELGLSAGLQKSWTIGVVLVGKNSDAKKSLFMSSKDKEISQWAKDVGALATDRGAIRHYRDFVHSEIDHLVTLGVGDTSQLTLECFRKTGAVLWQALKGEKLSGTSVFIENVPFKGKLSQESVGAFTEGIVLASYSFDELKGMNKKAATEKLKVNLVSSKKASLQKTVKASQTLAEAVNFSRRLGDMPGNLMTPTILAKETQAAAKGSGLKVTAWDRARIKKEKMGGLLGVSLGSSQEPRFIIMEYKGAASSKKPICFVGKGLTFDSGGISIKPSGGMEEMKYDMCGGANVIGTMIAIARLKLKVNVIGLVPSTENMPGASATKPGDVLTARNGKTIEVNNTDAEGRLILADALCYASEKKPAAIFDAATLTGAMVVALGNLHTGFFTRDEKLVDRIKKAGSASGENVWHMPLVKEHIDDMKGTFADTCNLAPSRGSGSATATGFLSYFVDEKIPWAHFDIAGTGWNVGGRLNYCSRKGASGAMVRTFVELAKTYK